MNENELLIKLFKDLFDGKPWIAVNIIDTLRGADVKAAADKPRPHQNSVWEILNHIIDWRLKVLSHLMGFPSDTPDNNYFEPITDLSPQAWSLTLDRLKRSQELWLEYLSDVSAEMFSKTLPGNTISNVELIHGIIQHDAYHLGQIKFLLKHHAP